MEVGDICNRNMVTIAARESVADAAQLMRKAHVGFLVVTEPKSDLITEVLGHIPPERLIISSDCGMGREGMSRRHAAYKMVSMVLGTNIVRKELGLPEAECLAADPRYSLAARRPE